MALLGLALLCPARPAHAESERLALVIGSSSYTNLPALEPCRNSASSLSGALRRAGFGVTERINPSNGQMGAAVSEFADALARASEPVALVYVCGYAVALDSRLFLLPASANLQRDTDALSQGILARQVVNSVSKSGARPGLILLDLVGLPGASAGLPLALLADPAGLAGKGLVAVQTMGSTPSSTTDLAAAVAGGLWSLASDPPGFFRGLRSKLANTAQRTVVSQEPNTPTSLASGPATVANAAAPSAAAPVQAELRRQQLALQRLGYYGGKVDGVAGQDTLAAIRRFQHELRAEMTGRLTPEQAERLLKDGQ
jgi:hypothetical protein